jgi:Flp pilus assembly protein TadD
MALAATEAELESKCDEIERTASKSGAGQQLQVQTARKQKSPKNKGGGKRSSREAVRLNPGHVQARDNLGDTHRMKSDHEGAQRSFTAVADVPTAGMEPSRAAEAGATTAAVPGAEAVVAPKRTPQLSPIDAETQGKLATALMKMGNLEGAVREAREVLRLNPEDVNAHRIVGAALGQMGDPEGAARSFMHAVRLDPADPKTHRCLGTALGQTGDMKGAERSFRHALLYDPEDATTHDYLGITLSKNGDYEGAEQELREALRLDPSYGQAHHNLAALLAHKGDLKGAEREAQEAVRFGDVGAERMLLNIQKELSGDLPRP